jgi:hypothetical protein
VGRRLDRTRLEQSDSNENVLKVGGLGVQEVVGARRVCLDAVDAAHIHLDPMLVRGQNLGNFVPYIHQCPNHCESDCSHSLAAKLAGDRQAPVVVVEVARHRKPCHTALKEAENAEVQRARIVAEAHHIGRCLLVCLWEEPMSADSYLSVGAVAAVAARKHPGAGYLLESGPSTAQGRAARDCADSLAEVVPEDEHAVGHQDRERPGLDTQSQQTE